jgi:hypothetical protein
MKVSEGLRNFLNAKKTANNADLVDRWSIDMELQLNVAADGNPAVEGKRNTYDDGQFEYFSFRIPKDAAHEPHFRDWTLTWPFDLHAEGIGMTGWNWKLRKSMWVGFDFDAITGHAPGVGVEEDELERVKQVAMSLPYIEVRKSTGGGGIHLYVHLDGIPTANHTEHAALSRCILGMMSSETGFDFASQIDACGGNMWFWHRKMTAENEGLKILKKAEKTLAIEDLPPNWRDHVEVVTRRRSKIRVMAEMGESEIDPFEQFASARRMVPLDEKHKWLVEELKHSGFSTIWVPDHHLLQTHTVALQETWEKGNIEGIFKTNSKGDHKETPNCFMFPMDKGAWHVYRFSEGVNEAETWRQDKEGWTNCFYNRKPTLSIAARAMGGQEDPDKGGFSFNTVTEAIKAAEVLGQTINVDEVYQHRTAKLKSHKDGRLIMQIDKHPNEKDAILAGWISKPRGWIKLFDTIVEETMEDSTFAEYDNIIRQMITPANDDAGWYIRSPDNSWQRFSTEKVKLRLLALGNSKPQIDLILGSTLGKTWKLVNVPFQPEYPGNRQWNVDAAQYSYKPVELDYDQAPQHPHWDKVLRHCGGDLDKAVRENEWCKVHNITSGADFLLYWMAFILREPFVPLPYLFFYGNQNCGKSIFHQAFKLLVSSGVASADRALGSNNDFNGELANCVLAYVEETDLSSNGGKAYSRIKDWTTNDELWIRRMRTDAYKQRNTLHFVHTANKLKHLYLEPNDTRIVVAYVPDFEPNEEIAHDALIERLKNEAPHFMRTIMDLTLPAPHSRLGLPPLRTKNKDRAEEIHGNAMDSFISENCYPTPGGLIEFNKFYKLFTEWLPPDGRAAWRKNVVIDEIKQRFPYGAHTANKRMIGNLSFEPAEQIKDHTPWMVDDTSRLVRTT